MTLRSLISCLGLNFLNAHVKRPDIISAKIARESPGRWSTTQDPAQGSNGSSSDDLT